MKEKLKKWLPSKRKLMQLYFALLFNANIRGFVSGKIYTGKSKKMCVPGINCYSCPGAVGACPLGSLQGAFQADRSTLYYMVGILLLYALAFGRMICGWLCPFGLVQELGYKIKTPKLKKSPVTRLLSFLKYAILVFFVFIVPILYGIRDKAMPAFCKYICPAGTLEGGIGLLSNKANAGEFGRLGFLFTWKFALMVSILVGCVFIFRLFCRFLCPLGALYGLFNKLSFFGIKVEKPNCTQCGKCVSHCKMDIRHVGDPECISCGECVDVCPTKAIVWKGPKIFLKENEGASPSPKYKKAKRITRSISAVLLIGLLALAIWGYWKKTAPIELPPSIPVDSNVELPPQGMEIGNLAYGANLQCFSAEGLSEETVNPAATGRLTIVNFWGTWCGPCKEELPDFDRIARDYAESVTVIAVHTEMGFTDSKNSPPDYVAETYPDSPMLFAKDFLQNNAEVYYTALGGTGSYPYTVILDENGVILAKYADKLHYDELKAAIEPHLP